MQKATKKSRGSNAEPTTTPKFPYTNKPTSLRKFLELIPKKPKPNKVNTDLLRSWGFKDSNDQTIIRVLKALKLVGSNNEPTDTYVKYMSPTTGPGILAEAVREVWGPLFESSHEPHREDSETLRNYFHIHSGGGEKAIALQIQTLKSVADHADFKTERSVGAGSLSKNIVEERAAFSENSSNSPAIHIDLHIHLPENKSRRDYEYIFEDIARYLFGRQTTEDERERD
jgi:hypothetical protein